MKAFTVHRLGPKEVGQWEERPEPSVGAHDLLVQIHAASINLLDHKLRAGAFKRVLPHKIPLILGNDFAGTVVAKGVSVTRFAVGDEVYARPHHDRIGSFAERIAVRESDVALKPRSLGMEEAAALPLVALTAWQALVELAQLRPGQRVFIQAGSGGVGHVAIQLAKHLGATVATTTSTANVAWVKALGADEVIDYTQAAFEAALAPCDVVLHSLGPKELDASLKLLKPGGRLVSISGPPTEVFARDLGLAWPLRKLMALLSWGVRRKARRLGASYDFLFMRAQGEQLRAIAELVDAGALRVVLDRVLPGAQAAEALAFVAKGRAKGKVVLSMR